MQQQGWQLSSGFVASLAISELIVAILCYRLRERQCGWGWKVVEAWGGRRNCGVAIKLDGSMTWGVCCQSAWRSLSDRT